MTELGDYKVRCDRCYKEAPSNNRSPYARDHPFQGIFAEDLFIRDESENWEVLKWSIQLTKQLDMAAKEGRKIKRPELAFCNRCENYFCENHLEADLCNDCVKEIHEINGMGNSAIPQQCIICRREIW